MKTTRISMGMPVSVEIVGETAEEGIEKVFEYFTQVDARFSTYRAESEVSRVNAGALALCEVSPECAEVLALAEQTTVESAGYFNIVRADGTIDPSGIVKGWALKKATDLLLSLGYEHFCIDAGGDISVHGVNAVGEPWSVGIRNPFNHDEVVKALYPKTLGVATSGSSARGDHIYNPHEPRQTLRDVVSITVIGPNILEADRFATAAFAMGTHGIDFIESLQGFEAYQIDANGIATMTRGFEHLTHA